MSSAGEKWKKYYKKQNLVWYNNNFKRDASYYQRMFEGSDLMAALMEDIGSDRTLNILEAGCGTGELSICLSYKYNNISTFDYNKGAIKIVNNLMEQAGQYINAYVDDLLDVKHKHKKYFQN